MNRATTFLAGALLAALAALCATRKTPHRAPAPAPAAPPQAPAPAAAGDAQSTAARWIRGTVNAVILASGIGICARGTYGPLDQLVWAWALALMVIILFLGPLLRGMTTPAVRAATLAQIATGAFLAFTATGAPDLTTPSIDQFLSLGTWLLFTGVLQLAGLVIADLVTLAARWIAGR